LKCHILSSGNVVVGLFFGRRGHTTKSSEVGGKKILVDFNYKHNLFKMELSRRFSVAEYENERKKYKNFDVCVEEKN
jgi:hypothetical protein